MKDSLCFLTIAFVLSCSNSNESSTNDASVVDSLTSDSNTSNSEDAKKPFDASNDECDMPFGNADTRSNTCDVSQENCGDPNTGIISLSNLEPYQIVFLDQVEGNQPTTFRAVGTTPQLKVSPVTIDTEGIVSLKVEALETRDAHLTVTIDYEEIPRNYCFRFLII